MLRSIAFRRILIVVAILSTCLLAACTPERQTSTDQIFTIQNPTAAEWLKSEPDASLFQYKDTIYVADVSWVNDLELTRGDLITKVLRQHTDGESFQNGDANHLEKETPIYEAKEQGDVLIASTPKGDIRFFQLVEG